jgi:hypothetical protein
MRSLPFFLTVIFHWVEEDSGTRSINATGLLIHLKKSIFIISSFILQKLLGIITILSDQLKSTSLFFVA